ncbi:MAG: hypothetical protein ABFD65_01400 [Candidatus Polarisedimenticolia bacterium]
MKRMWGVLVVALTLCIAADEGVTFVIRLVERKVLSESTLELTIASAAEKVPLSDCHLQFFSGRKPDVATLVPFAYCDMVPSGELTVGRSHPAKLTLQLNELHCTDSSRRTMPSGEFRAWIDKGDWRARAVVCDWRVAIGNKSDCYVRSDLIAPQGDAPPRS